MASDVGRFPKMRMVAEETSENGSHATQYDGIIIYSPESFTHLE